MLISLFNTNGILSASTPTPAIRGGLWTISALALCFLATHLFLFAKSKKRNVSPPQTEEKPPQKEKEQAPATQEPVYYIVEKKRRRVKQSYGEPKEIRFR